MTAIHSQVPHGGRRRVWHRPQRARRLVERVLAAVHDWRRRRRDRLQIAALDDRISSDLEIYRSDPLNLHREQKECDAWFDTLGFNSKDRPGWSNEGREVFAPWILALLGAALAVLLLASHQPSTSDLRLPQWSDPPVGAESWADDLLAGRDGNLVPALGITAAPDPLPQQ